MENIALGVMWIQNSNAPLEPAGCLTSLISGALRRQLSLLAEQGPVGSWACIWGGLHHMSPRWGILHTSASGGATLCRAQGQGRVHHFAVQSSTRCLITSFKMSGKRGSLASMEGAHDMSYLGSLFARTWDVAPVSKSQS